MPSRFGGGAVPDYGASLERKGQLALLNSSSRPVLLLCAPSGYGKSVVASQFARSPGFSAATWIDCFGQQVGAVGLLELLVAALTQQPSEPDQPSDGKQRDQDALLLEMATQLSRLDGRPFCIVIDDFRFGESTIQSLLVEIARLVSRYGGILVITSRRADAEEIVSLDAAVLDESDLQFSMGEARELAVLLLGAGHEPNVDVEDVCTQCGGQPALLSVLLRQATKADSLARPLSVANEIERLLRAELDENERAALSILALLSSGSADDVEALGLGLGSEVLQDLARRVPLLRVSRNASKTSTLFRVHDLLTEHLFGEARSRLSPEAITAVVSLLTLASRFEQAARVLGLSGRDSIAEWLLDNGDSLLRRGALDLTEALFERIDPQRLIGSPRLLVLQARLLNHRGQTEAASSRITAACSIAKFENDRVAHAEALHARTDMAIERGDMDQGLKAAEELWSLASSEVPSRLRVSALIAIASCRLYQGEASESTSLLQAASRQASEEGLLDLWRTAVSGLGVAAAWLRGDFAEAARAFGELQRSEPQGTLDRVRAMGNLAAALCQTGRLVRALEYSSSCVESARTLGLAGWAAPFLSVVGAARVGVGEVDSGLRQMRQAVDESERSDDTASAAQCWLYLATALRARGLGDGMVESERAFELFGVCGNAFERRLAVLELAASFLALGDSSRAERIISADGLEGATQNRYHLLRSDMILAEIARREGRIEDAVATIVAHEVYILSESSNWQIAMYCRAFPGLLGVFALAIEPAALPVHMLRMILPDNAEHALTETRALLGEERWQTLGRRLLGEEEFEHFIERDGRPLCRVRMFGGLEVSVGGRAVGERDWKKRKARLLFAMLVSRRGQDVPRDQVLDYLWPEMDEARARNNLYVVWSAMKGALLGDGDKSAHLPYVENSRGMCRINADAVRSDVDEFERKLAEGRAADADSDAQRALVAYESLAEVYRGELLPGDIYDDWFATERDRYKAEFVSSMRRAAQLAEERSQLGAALHYLRRAIHADPWQEDLYQHSLRCQITAGQRGAAIETYLQCRSRLSDDLGLDPSAETRALYDQVLAMEDRPGALEYYDPLGD